MKADLRWLDDPEVFRVNQLPAHSDHQFYRKSRAIHHTHTSIKNRQF